MWSCFCGGASAAETEDGLRGQEVREDRWEDWRAYLLPLNNPAVVPAAEAAHMRPDDLVVGLEFAGRARAYPWWILDKYHVVNDTVEGKPLLVVLCEACGAASAFVPALDQKILEFAVCGARNGTFAVCDYETRSRWHPFSDRSYDGPLKGARLARVRVSVARWQEWVKLHSETLVPPGSQELRARPHGYDATVGAPFIPQNFKATLHAPDPRLPQNELVFGLIPAGRGKGRAYPLKSLRQGEGGAIQDTFDGRPIALFLEGEYRIAAYVRRVGSEILELEGLSKDPLTLRDQSGSVWNDRGIALSGPHKGKTLELADGYLTEWYQWSDSYPGSELAMPRFARSSE